ncbi:MAG: SufE family protein [Hyphomicrobiaceae bacterium]|nr:MAG: SufE family protein [Hyphomicrobiaceae bacterium]
MTIDEIVSDLEFLDDWEDRYRYLIDLGRSLEPLQDGERTAANKVQGCVSQVWLVTKVERSEAGSPRLTFRGDSDAMIVRGLVALLLSIFSGKTPREIHRIDAAAIFKRLGLGEHLTPQRSNGLNSMVNRLRADAARARSMAV